MREAALTRMQISCKERKLNNLLIYPSLNSNSSTLINVNTVQTSFMPFKLQQKTLQNTKKPIAKAKKQLLLNSASDSETILFWVMIKFLFSRLMPTILDVAEHFVGSVEFVNSLRVTMFVDTSNLIVVCSSAANFLIFFTFSRSFRNFFKKNFCFNFEIFRSSSKKRWQCCLLSYKKLLPTEITNERERNSLNSFKNSTIDFEATNKIIKSDTKLLTPPSTSKILIFDDLVSFTEISKNDNEATAIVFPYSDFYKTSSHITSKFFLSNVFEIENYNAYYINADDYSTHSTISELLMNYTTKTSALKPINKKKFLSFEALETFQNYSFSINNKNFQSAQNICYTSLTNIYNKNLKKTISIESSNSNASYLLSKSKKVLSQSAQSLQKITCKKKRRSFSLIQFMSVDK